MDGWMDGSDLEEWIELGVEAQGPGTIDDAPINLCSEVDAHDVTLLEDGLASAVRSEVSGDVVD